MTTRKTFRILVGACCIASIGLVLGACRQEEQGRVLNYKAGTYLGKTDQKLSDKQVRELSLRTTRQGS
jgi:hypothetical protein